jgi:Coenzyme PQQ synthesis protein D (PqqD)
MNDATVLIRREDCLEEILEGEVVLYSASASQALYLNESASLVWMLINGERRLGLIIKLLSDAYPDVDNIRSDVASTVMSLIEHGAVLINEES